MSKLQRTIFFWSLVFLFLMTAPLVVLKARGYKFDLSRGVFVYSGSINIKSNPQNINVSLNGEPKESTKLDRINNSFNVSGLLPGEYSIEISAPGFQTWQKKTNVHSGLASEFWNVLLVRDSYEETTYENSASQKFFTSPNNDFIALYGEKDSTLSVEILNTNSNALDNSFSIAQQKMIPEEIEENVEWSPVRNNRISIPAYKEAVETKAASLSKALSSQKDIAQPRLNYFIADLSQGNSFSLNDFLDISDIRNLRWDPQNENFVFFLSGDKLMRANISDKNLLSTIAEDVSAFDLSQNYVFYVQLSNNIVYKKALSGGNDKTQITNNFPEGISGKIRKIIIYDNDRMAFLDEKNNLFIFNQGEHDTYFKKIGERIIGMYFSNDGKKLLFWTNNEISVYFARDWNVQPTRTENEIKNITRYIESVRNVQWFSDYEHIIFNVGNYTKIIELDSRDQRNCMDLVRTDSLFPHIVYNSSLEKLFFTDEKNGQWKLYSIGFPEPTTILGF